MHDLIRLRCPLSPPLLPETPLTTQSQSHICPPSALALITPESLPRKSKRKPPRRIQSGCWGDGLVYTAFFASFLRCEGLVRACMAGFVWGGKWRVI